MLLQRSGRKPEQASTCTTGTRLSATSSGLMMYGPSPMRSTQQRLRMAQQIVHCAADHNLSFKTGSLEIMTKCFAADQSCKGFYALGRECRPPHYPWTRSMKCLGVILDQKGSTTASVMDRMAAAERHFQAREGQLGSKRCTSVRTNPEVLCNSYAISSVGMPWLITHSLQCRCLRALRDQFA